jgi:ATP-dependent exoDNAse (exonuclease V) beta subunit
MKAPSKAQPAERSEPRELPGECSSQPSLRRRLLGVSPSTIEGREVRADLLFTHVTHDSIELGQAVHELFEKVSWIDEVDIEALIQEWQETSRVLEEVRRRAVEQFRKAIASAEVRHVLSRPSGSVALWHEKHFEIVLEDQWITGVFDRVTIVQGTDGRPLQATILDFKSNETKDDTELASTAEYYRPQLLLYGRALSRMLQVDPSRVTPQLLFACSGKVYVIHQGL